MEILSSLAFVWLFIFSATGWGLVIRRLLGVSVLFGAVPALGIAALLLLGGLFVAIGIVSKLFLIGLLLLGSVFSLATIIRVGSTTKGSFRSAGIKAVRQLLPYSGVIMAGLIAVVFSSQPSAFHMTDDLEKYLKYPLRLLETGGLKTGPFDALGTEALGGMSFLQSFALVFGPLEQVNAMDAVIGLIVAMACLVSVLRTLGMPGWWCVLTSLLIPLVDPLYVNVSAAFTGVALLILAFAFPVFTKPHALYAGWRNSIVLGGIYAALVSLKTTFALFVPIHFTSLLLMHLLQKGALRSVLSGFWKVPLAATFLAAPWFWVHWEKGYSWALQLSSSSPFSRLEVPTNSSFPGWRPFAFDAPAVGFLSCNALFSLLVMAITVTTIIEIVRGPWRKMKGRQIALISCGLTVSLVYWIGLYWMAYRMSGPDSALRYAMPLIIAGCLVIALSGPTTQARLPSHSPHPLHWVCYRKYSILVASIIALAFAPSYLARISQSHKVGHAIGIPSLANLRYIHWFQQQMSDEVSSRIRNAQTAVPACASVLVWIGSPVHLDYSRNPIYDVDLAGLTSPWSGYPFFEDTEAQVTFLRGLGIEFVFWQYRNSPDRSLVFLRHREQQPYLRRHLAGRNGAAFLQSLQQMSFSSQYAQTIYDDGEYRVMKLTGQDAPAE